MATRQIVTYDERGGRTTRDVEVDDETVNADAVYDKIQQGIALLEAADANWGTLTNAQKDQATRLAVRGVAKLARLALGRFEAS